MITPSSTVKFLQVPFSLSQDNVLKFSDVNSQISYMTSKIVNTFNGCQYLREGEREFLRVGKVIDQLYNSNYVMFQNSNFSNKWFYAFIEKMEYKNSSVTELTLKLDVYQTFQFDFTLQKSFIERQTFSEDYYNTLADTPSTGDLKTVWEYQKPLNGLYFILFNSDPTKDDTTVSPAYYPIINNYSMPCYMAFTHTSTEMSELVQEISNKGRADRIQGCYFAPCLGDTNFEIWLHDKGDLNLSYSSYIELVKNMTLDRLSEVVTFSIPYTPMFKKEISYPYAKLEIVDKITGKFIELDLSKFENPLNPQFTMLYGITGRCEYKVVPLNYNGIAYSIENSLVIEPNTDLPTFSNTYAKYLKDNQASNVLSGVMSLASGIGSIMTDNIAGAVGSFGNIANSILADSVARKQPNQVSGIKGDAFEYVNYNPCIYFRLKVMDSNHMDIARNFWNSFGYPLRKITTFNNTNQKFNFIKTVNSNIIASTIPSEYQIELEQMFDKGVTIWNNNYLEYDII